MKRAEKIKKKNEQIKKEKKIQRKIIQEKDISSVRYYAELSRGDMAVIINALEWSNDSSTFKMMPRTYKTKHKKVLSNFTDVMGL